LADGGEVPGGVDAGAGTGVAKMRGGSAVAATAGISGAATGTGQMTR
jgi:hypothetical protein